MTARLRTEVTQLSIVAGTRQENAGDVGLVETSSLIPRGTGKGNFYLLVQVTGEALGKEEIHRELIDILSQEYFRVPGGITNGLRQAIRAANTHLYERNLEALPLWQRTGETCCAVLRGNDLYVGLAGDALVCVLQQGNVSVFPPTSTRHLGPSLPEEPPRLPPLGEEESLLDVGLFHCRIDEDDIILLASSGLPQVVTNQELIMAAQGELEGLSDALSSLASHADVSALLIQVQPAERETAVQKEALPLRTGREAPSPERTPPDRTAAPAPETRTLGITPRLPRVAVAFGVAILAFVASLGSAARSFFSWLFSSGILGIIVRGIKAGLINILQAFGTLTERMLPEPQAAPKPLETSYVPPVRAVPQKGERGSRLPLIGVLAIVCVIAVVAASLVLRFQSRDTYFSQVLDDARTELDLARTSDSRALAREHLAKAEELVEEALQMKAANPDAIALQEQVGLESDRVDQVVRLLFSAQLPFAALENEPARLVAHVDDIYVLDEKTQELYGYLLDDRSSFQEPAGGPVLLRPESRFGDVAVQELNDLVWMEAGNGRETSNLLILVNGGSLLQLDALRGLTPVSVAGSDLWVDPRRIGAYFGYLYVLDAGEDRILKYAPTGDSYDSAPTDYLLGETTVELASAVDMAIDGYMYVLLTDGQILKFSGGLPEAFSVTGLDDHGLQNPVAIFTSPETEYLYVADAGNERIVQLTKEGAFVQQFRPSRDGEDVFQYLRDVSVDEESGEFLVLTSEALALAPTIESPHVEE